MKKLLKKTVLISTLLTSLLHPNTTLSENSSLIQTQNQRIEQIKQTGKWFFNKKDLILEKMYDRYQNKLFFSSFFDQLTQEEIDVVHKFYIEIGGLLTNKNNNINEKDLHWKLKALRAIAQEIINYERSTKEFLEKDLTEQSFIREYLTLLSRIYPLKIKKIRFGDPKILDYVNVDRLKVLLQAREYLMKKYKLGNLSQKEQDYIYYLNGTLDRFSYVMRRKFITEFLKDPKITPGDSIFENVKNKNESLQLNNLGIYEIHLKYLNPYFARKNLELSQEYDINPKIPSIFMLKENNFGGNKTSSSNAIGPLQAKYDYVIKPFLQSIGINKPWNSFSSEQQLDYSYRAGIWHIHRLIKKYNLHLYFNSKIPLLKSPEDYFKLNNEEKEIVLDYLTLFSFYYTGESDLRFILEHSFNKETLNYLRKALHSLSVILVYELNKKDKSISL
jgi:hypothetical protein